MKSRDKDDMGMVEEGDVCEDSGACGICFVALQE